MSCSVTTGSRLTDPLSFPSVSRKRSALSLGTSVSHHGRIGVIFGGGSAVKLSVSAVSESDVRPDKGIDSAESAEGPALSEPVAMRTFAIASSIKSTALSGN